MIDECSARIADRSDITVVNASERQSNMTAEIQLYWLTHLTPTHTLPRSRMHAVLWRSQERLSQNVYPLVYLRNHTAELYQFLCTFPVTMTRSSSDGFAIRYVLPVLWITSCFHIRRCIARHVYAYNTFHLDLRSLQNTNSKS